MSDVAKFGRLAAALNPWNHQLVYVGGWAHRLYRQHPLADPPAYMPVTTQDADVAFAESEELTGSIEKALSNAGFKEELMGECQPPVSQYTLGDEDSGFYAEFLTPLHGSGRKRSGDLDATVLKAGITAQKLRDLEILLRSPWRVSVSVAQDPNADDSVELWIPNPVAFIIQKVLIRTHRRPDKRAQDVLYIHDTLELFASQLPALADVWTKQVASALAEKQRDDVTDGVRDMFAAVTDTLRDAARIPQDRSLVPERMRAFCEQAMGAVLLQGPA